MLMQLVDTGIKQNYKDKRRQHYTSVMSVLRVQLQAKAQAIIVAVGAASMKSPNRGSLS